MWRALQLLVSFLFLLLAVASANIRVVVLEGDGAINNIRLHRAKEPVIQVLDDTGKPVGGVTVTFSLPSHGAGGVFTDGGRTLTVQTDARGQAIARGLRPNAMAGEFPIRVTASWHGQTASTSFSQVNAEPARAGGSGKKIAILAIVGGAVAGGVLVTHRSQKPEAAGIVSSSGPGTIIVPGTPAFSPPQ